MQPITTKGNWFWKGDERFFIKSIQYILHDVDNPDSIIDILSDDNFAKGLKKDIKLFKTLGINTIQVYKYDPTVSHTKALKLLEENGIYVIITILELENIGPGGKRTRGIFEHEFDADFEPGFFYTPFLATRMLRVIAQTAGYSNVLAYQVEAEKVVTPKCSRLAEVARAAVRDAKRFLATATARAGTDSQQRQEGDEEGTGFRRGIPVGVTTCGDMKMVNHSQMEYFNAGDPAERPDFYALTEHSWAGAQSSFRISGWQALLENRLSRFPVPMLFSTYGAAMYAPRTFEETLCLYSPDCTGVLSGGGIYQFAVDRERDWESKYGLVEVRGQDGKRVPRHSFWWLRRRLKEVEQRRPEEVATADVKDFESWRGTFDATAARGQNWLARLDALPAFPRSWDEVSSELLGVGETVTLPIR